MEDPPISLDEIERIAREALEVSGGADNALELYSEALVDFWEGRVDTLLYVRSCDDYCMPYDMYDYFTTEFNELESAAIEEVRGRVLDVGAGSGRHSLYLQKRDVDSVAVEILPAGVWLMRERKVRNHYCLNVLDPRLYAEVVTDDANVHRCVEPVFRGVQLPSIDDFLKVEAPRHQFDTILMLCDTIGMVGSIYNVRLLLRRLRQFVKIPGGQLLLDCSDIEQELSGDENGVHTAHVELCKRLSVYCGQLLMHYEYKDRSGSHFWWLYLGIERLRELAADTGWRVDILKEDGVEYLARLTPVGGV